MNTEKDIKANTPEKKSYQAPVLTSFGSLQDLTRGNFAGTQDGDAGLSMTRDDMSKGNNGFWLNL